MLYRDARSWKYFSSGENSWIDAATLDFAQAVAQAGRGAESCVTQPKEALPAFSGSKVICVGRNYRKHAAELGHDVPERPLWFSKPPSAVIGNGGKVWLPRGMGRVDYEGELAMVIGRRASKVKVADALNYIGGVTACFDMTARDLQKSDGQWTRAKGFDTFLPLSGLISLYDDSWQKGRIEVKKNGIVVQNDSFSSMVFGFAELLADLSACMTLEPGDLVLTGTPEGVGPVVAGDHLEMTISGPVKITLQIDCE